MYKNYAVDHDTGMAAFGSCCNWTSFFFALFAACSPFWAWGYYYGEVPHGGVHPYGYASASSSPFIAGFVYKTVPSYACPWCWQTFSTYPVYWTNVNGQAACRPNSTVYAEWSGPLGYCSKSTASSLIFTPPSQAVNTQGLIIASCVFVGLAAILGCVDACSEGESAGLPKLTTAFSFLGLILLICSFSLWVDFEFVSLLTSYDGFYMPIWLNPYSNLLSAVPVYFVLGPGWGCALFAFILTFFATCLHGFSMSPLAKGEELPEIPGLPKADVPPAAGAPAPAQGPVVSV